MNGDFKNILNLEKINELKNLEFEIGDDYQDGCFELEETFNYKIIENKTILVIDEKVLSSINDDIYNIYKEHNALDLYYNQNVIYLSFDYKQQMIDLDVCAIKRIL